MRKIPIAKQEKGSVPNRDALKIETLMLVRKIPTKVIMIRFIVDEFIDFPPIKNTFNISFIIMSSSKKSMDMCEGDSEKCEGKLKEKIAFNLQNAIFFCTFQYGTILKYESL